MRPKHRLTIRTSVTEVSGKHGAEADLAEDDRLIIATAIARTYTLVTASAAVIEAIARRTSQLTMEP